MKRIILTVGIATLSLLPGCIVQEIRDELKGVNSNLATVQESLDKLDETNERILKTNESLSRTNTLIDGVEKGLGRIDNTNTSLGSVDQRLSLLASIDKSLNRLDSHLASLRGTISKLDSAIPFLDLGGGEVPAEAPAATAGAEPGAAPEVVAVAPAQPAPSGEPPAAADPAQPAEQPLTKRTPDPLQGTWIVRYPADGGAFVLMPDGSYIRADPHDTAPETRGTWKRDGTKIEFVQTFPQVFARKAGAPAATTAEASVSAKDNPNMEPISAKPQTMEVISTSPRAATVRLNGKLMVFARPT